MKSNRRGILFGIWLWIAILSSPPLDAAENKLLWEIGKPDDNNAEFALAPGNYGQYREDGFFVVGRSDPSRDWPYAHPGPADAWGGNRKHTFMILFGVQRPAEKGECRLQFRLLDTHASSPPTLEVNINGQTFKASLPKGAGDASIFGQPGEGRHCQSEIVFKSSLLKAGENEIGITAIDGSWLLYDSIGLTGPAALELDAVPGRTIVGAIEAPPVLDEKEGRMLQPVRLAIRHFGDETDATVKVEGAEPFILRLRTGSQVVEAPVPAVEKAAQVGVTVEIDGKIAASRQANLKPVRKWVVYLLPHSHVDIGYTHVQTDVERAQWKYLEMAMETARKTAGNPPGARFKWNCEVLWAVDGYLKQATPEKRQAFFDAVKAGQVGLDALYGNELTGLCRPEELLRLVGLATKLSQQTEVPIESAMITDVPGYTWGIVPAFAHSGVKYFSIGPNGGDRIGHTIAAWGDKPFWWIGPNGRDKVLVWMTGTGYYQVFQSPRMLQDYLARLEEKDYPYDMVQVRHCLGDNGAPDVNFADKVKAWNDAHAYPKLVIATTAEMFRDLERQYGDKLPKAKGDFTPYWEDGAASSARETAMNRASADRLIQAETLFAMFNPKAYPATEFEQAWRDVILYDEHTWGAHNSISEPDAPFVKSQWAIKQAFALDADKKSRKLIEMADESRGAKVEPPSQKMNVIDAVKTRTTAGCIPNSLVVIPKELSTAGDFVASSPTNKHSFLTQRLSSGELVFRLSTGPGTYSFRFYIHGEGGIKDQFDNATTDGITMVTSTQEPNRGLTLRLDEKSGAIASLRYQGRELVDTKAPNALNDYFYLPGSDLKGLQRNGPVKITIKEKGPLIASLLVESDAPGCIKLTREIRAHALRHYVEIIDTVDKKAVRSKEGVHFGFAFNVPGGVMRMDVPWGVVQPELDQIPGACKNWFTVQRWVDISNKDYGVTWLTPDAPLVQVGGITANLIGSLSDPRAWIEHLEPSTTIYSWAMNNHWHTNYHAEQDGPTVFRYYIFPHDGSTGADNAAQLALEHDQPLLVLPARGESHQPPRFQVISPQSKYQVTAFKPSADGKAWIVRLFGMSDTPANVRLNWVDPHPKRVWLSDNSERPIKSIDGSFEIPAWSIVTVRAEM